MKGNKIGLHSFYISLLLYILPLHKYSPRVSSFISFIELIADQHLPFATAKSVSHPIYLLFSPLSSTYPTIVLFYLIHTHSSFHFFHISLTFTYTHVHSYSFLTLILCLNLVTYTIFLAHTFLLSSNICYEFFYYYIFIIIFLINYHFHR